MDSSHLSSSYNTFIKCNKLVVLNPVHLKGINLRGSSSFSLHCLKGLGKRLNVLCGTEDELVVAHVNSAADQLSTLGVGSSDDKVLASHHVPLETSGDESVDMLGHGHKDFARQVAALLPAMHLVLEMDCGGAVLCKELRQLQNSRQPAVTARNALTK